MQNLTPTELAYLKGKADQVVMFGQARAAVLKARDAIRHAEATLASMHGEHDDLADHAETIDSQLKQLSNAILARWRQLHPDLATMPELQPEA